MIPRTTTESSGEPPMTEQLKNAVRHYWDQRPCGVKHTAQPPRTRAFYEEIEAQRYGEEFHIPAVAEFASHPGERVLEIGGGIGTDGRQFAKGGARYVDADLSYQSAHLARDGFRCSGLAGQFVQSDAENLPFGDGRFDVVYSHGVLHHTPGTARAIEEAHRVLRPGGRAIVMLYARESFHYVVGVHVAGRARLALARRRMGRRDFNRMVGLPPEHRGWLPESVVVNNSTDGLANPLSRMFTAPEIRHLFRAFKSVSLNKYYFPRLKVPVIGRHIPDTLAYWMGRAMGTCWWIKAV